MSEEKSVIVKTKERVVETIQETGEITNALVVLISGSLVTALKGAKAVGAEAGSLVKDTMIGSVQGIPEVGAEAGSTAQSVILGVMKGTKEVTTNTLEPIGTSTST